MPDQKKWVIIFLIYADFVETSGNNPPGFNIHFAQELDRFLASLLKTQFNSRNIDIYIIYGTLNFQEAGVSGAPHSIISSTYLFQLLPGQGENRINFLKPFGKSQVNNNTIGIPGTFKLQHSESLSEIFNFINSRYPKRENISILLNSWDHGAAFGIFGSLKPITFLSTIPLPGSKELPTIAKFIEKIPPENLVQLKSSKKTLKDKSFLYNNRIYSSPYSAFIEANISTIGANIEKGLLKTEMNGSSFTIKATFTIKQQESNLYNFQHLWGNIPPNNFLFEKNETLSAKDFEISANFEGLLEILTNEELSLAIHNSFGKVDILVMMNCWMMNLHCLYAMRTTVDYLVAPQGGISEPGYDFIRIINKINQGVVLPDKIANYIVDSSYDFSVAGRNTASKIKEIRNWALMAAKITGNLSLIEKDIPDIINDFADKMISDNNIKTNLRKKLYLQYLSKVSYIFSNDNGIKFFQIDLLNWLRIIERHNNPIGGGEGILRNLFLFHSAALKKICDNIFISNKSLLENSYDFRIKEDTFSFIGISALPPNGTSIYLPMINNEQELGHKLFMATTNEIEKEYKLSNKIEKWGAFLNDLNAPA